jgi:hypothetical protein
MDKVTEVVRQNAEAMSVFPVNHDSRAYAEGRHDMARDILAEMEERGKP